MELFIMNIYDTKLIHCSKCEKFIGEIDYDAIVMLPKCGKCVNQTLKENNRIDITSKNEEISVMTHKPILYRTLFYI